MEKFARKAHFYQVIGAIDGTHIAIKTQTHNEHLYINRKGYHSINCQVVCDSEHIIMNCVAKYPGSTHDSFIWANCHLRTRLEHGEYGGNVLLGMYCQSLGEAYCPLKMKRVKLSCEKEILILPPYRILPLQKKCPL